MEASSSLATAAHDAPDVPGIYVFLSRDAELLYVGKATSLRKRLKQHAASKASPPSRLGVLYRDTAEVRWEVQPSEADAAAREADLIVALGPALNASISDNGQWVFVVVDTAGERVRFSLAAEPTGGRAYGCFPHLGKGVSSTRGIACSEGYAALMRLLWAAHAAAPGDQFPRRIAGISPPESFETTVPPGWQRGLHALLSGTSRALLPALSQGAARLDDYLQPGLRRDRAGAEGFFAHGPAALRALRLRHHLAPGPLSRAVIEQLLAADLRESIGEFRLPDRVDPTDGLLGRRASRNRALHTAVRARREGATGP